MKWDKQLKTLVGMKLTRSLYLIWAMRVYSATKVNGFLVVLLRNSLGIDSGHLLSNAYFSNTINILKA